MTKFHAKMPIKEENIRFSGLILEAFLTTQIKLSLASEIKNELRTALSEAVANVVVHSNGTIIKLELDCDEQFIYVSVTDNGCGIEDINKAREPLYTTKSDEERSGMGFTIMEVFSDKLVVKSKVGCGVIVKMKKRYC